MRLGVIYKATCILNGKEYIGRTIEKNPYRRIMTHKCNSTKKINRKFYNAIKLHGWDNFQWQIVCNEVSEDQLPKMEEFFVALYDTYENGYNSTKGGDVNPMDCPEIRKKMVGRKHTEETKRKISECKIGTKHTDETKRKMSENKIGEKNCNFGKQFSNETKNKLKLSHIKYEYQVIYPNGTTIIINNIREFCRDNNLDASVAYKVINGKYKHYKQYKFVRLNADQN